MDLSDKLVDVAKNLCTEVDKLQFSSPVAMTYNPLTYAWAPHEMYLRKYGTTKKKCLFLGMNPGPFGMAQTGVPFGEISAVKNWMHIEAPVARPPITHPKRPITGFDCEKSEVSGRRLWGLFAELFPSAEVFFQDHFVANYCPLIWMSDTGANITPDKLSPGERQAVDKACLHHLACVIEILKPEILIGVGGYAQKKLQQVKEGMRLSTVRVETILHPSPASPAANKNWPALPTQQLRSIGVIS